MISIKYLTEIHGFDHHTLKLVYPFLENKQTIQKKILSTCKIKPIEARNLKWIYANAKIKTKHWID